MKKLFIAVMALATIVSCSKENEEANVTPVGGETALLSVSLKSVDDLTRAGVVGSYKDGDDTENTVSNVDFYFFNADGSAYAVDGTDNFISVTPNFAAEGDVTNNIESVSDVVLVIKGAEKKLPTQMVAIVNAPVAATAKSLSELEASVLETLKNEGGNFVMSNSVYMNGTVKITATQILPENIFVDPNYDGAVGEKYNGSVNVTPIDIYVERVAAKVEVKLTNGGLYDTGEKYEGETIYAQVLGWGVTNNTAQANLIKSIDPMWTDLGLGFAWNNAGHFRSHWAATTAVPAHNLSFTALTNHTATADYYFENTKPAAEKNSVISGEGNQTPQLLVAAKLVVKNGENYEALELGEWYGVQYTIEDLKTVMINTVASKLFKKGNAANEFVSIGKDDVVFEQMPATTPDKRYEVVVKVKSGFEYFNAAGELATDAQAILDGIQPAKMWKTGSAYYFTNIQHYGNKTGIVRNHWYEINVNAITGLGTPVYNPELVIVPEIPEKDKAAHLAAEINVLSWALVSQNVNLGN